MGRTIGKAALVLGILGVLLGAVVAIVSLLLPSMTRNVSPSEAAIGIAAGLVVAGLSFIPAIAGVVMLVVIKKT